MNWAERTDVRLGELDQSGRFLLGYCLGIIRGSVLTLAEAEEVGLDEAGDWGINLMDKTINKYAKVHGGNAELIRSIIRDWAWDEEAR